MRGPAPRRRGGPLVSGRAVKAVYRNPTRDWNAYALVVADAVRQQRLLEDWTQGELAQRAGLGVGVISHLENGLSVTLRNLWRVARAFGMRGPEALLP